MATKKKAPVKTKKSSKRSTYVFQPKTFELTDGPKPFMTFKVTRQTVYWVILLTVISFLTLWILKLQIDILTILNNLNITR